MTTRNIIFIFTVSNRKWELQIEKVSNNQSTELLRFFNWSKKERHNNNKFRWINYPIRYMPCIMSASARTWLPVSDKCMPSQNTYSVALLQLLANSGLQNSDVVATFPVPQHPLFATANPNYHKRYIYCVSVSQDF